MNIAHPHITSMPNRIHYQPAACRSLPSSLEVGDHWGIHGLGTGATAFQAGIGEFFERRHFYHEIVSSVSHTLGESLTREEVTSFSRAFDQTSKTSFSARTIENHKFIMSRVYRSKDFSSCHIPTACLTINSVAGVKDDLFYPLKDTCGCSFHSNPDKALLGSLKETIERQMLLRFWLTRSCLGKIDDVAARSMLSHSQASGLYLSLHESGHLEIIDITDPDYPGACILAVFGSPNKKSLVRYCAGMSYSSSHQAAIEKALLELWQTFRFMNIHHEKIDEYRDLTDPYLRHFLNCNKFETFLDITDVCAQPQPSGASTIGLSLNTLLMALRDSAIDGYFYLNSKTIGCRDFYFSKFISPQYFMHMNNSQNINLRCKYSDTFHTSMLLRRKSKMVPFP